LFVWVGRRATVTLDGVEVVPALASFAFDPGDPALLPLFPVHGAKALSQVRFRLRYAPSVPGARLDVADLVWRAYPPNLQQTGAADAWLEVRALLTAGGREQVVVLRHDEPQFTWRAPPDGLEVRLLPVPQPPPLSGVRVPVASAVVLGLLGIASVLALARGNAHRLPLIVIAGVGLAALAWPLWRIEVALPWRRVALPSAEQAAAIFLPLHGNVYRAFAHTEPSAVYDALAASVEGSLLDTLYQDVYRSLVMQEQGGAMSRVQAVRPMVTEIEDIGVLADGRTASFVVDASWQVDGAVFHWGHEHHRTSALRARYTVVETDAGWRIAGAEPLAQERVEPATVAPLGQEASK
jgi:hypothetical protein